MFALLERHSKRARLAGLGTVLLALLAVPAFAQQKPSGAEVWGANCARCHRLRALDAYDARQWETIVASMALQARLTPDETEAVREFLVGAARARETRSSAAAARTGREPVLLASAAPLASVLGNIVCCDPTVGRAVFRSECVVCHGEGGKGDGPVAVALNPPPANLADVARMAQISDDSLVQTVTKGRGGMPGFERGLTPEQVREVVSYIRNLKP